MFAVIKNSNKLFKPEKCVALQTPINFIEIDFEAIFLFVEFIEFSPLVFVAFSFFRICSQFTFSWLTYKSETSNSNNNKKPFENNIVCLNINWKQTSNRLTEYMNRKKKTTDNILCTHEYLYTAFAFYAHTHSVGI